jgi:polysaccharide deacetylase family protein (PEP-CTERM system associated)
MSLYTNLVSTPAGNERFRDSQSRGEALRAHADQTVNALTIDVEDYFQVSAFAPYIERAKWDSIPCRAEANVMRILGLLDQHDAKATFFTLGWIAERHPNIVREIVARGHELASHGYAHLRASDQTPAEFTEDIVRAKALLEDIGGVRVRGYRAPSFSINQDNLWALACIRDAGYRYSSSIYPVRHDHYGMPDAPRFAYTSMPELVEVPVTTVDLFKRNWPAGGGGYFRLLPYALSRWLLQRVNRVDGEPCMFYFHPWEVDPSQPRVPGIDARTRFRHYVNLDRMQARLERLLQDFRWGRVDRVFLHDPL